MTKILLHIDDDPDDCEMLSDVLKEKPQIAYVCFYSPLEALIYLQCDKIKPDLILLDMNMPAMNGIAVLSAIKQHKKLADIPIVMFSTGSQADVKMRAIRLGANDYVTKPTSYVGLKKIVNTLIGTYLPQS